MDDRVPPWTGGAAAVVRLPREICPATTAGAVSRVLRLPVEGPAVAPGKLDGLHGPVRHLPCPHRPAWALTRPEGMAEIVDRRAALLDQHGRSALLVKARTREGKHLGRAALPSTASSPWPIPP